MRAGMATGGVTRGRRHPRLSPRAARALRRGPRARASAGVASDRAGGPAPAGLDEGDSLRVLVEWHDMTPGELVASWAGLRAWVAWLSGRYELSVEERLPACWALHPGLVEELWALKAWREEVYSSGQPGQGQGARYWHSELRTVVQAATTFYAAGCRTGHRGAAGLARIDAGLLAEWGGAYPLAGVPDVDIAAGQARGTGARTSGEEMAAALDAGDAVPVPGADVVTWDGQAWAPAASGWVQVPGLGLPAVPDAAGREGTGLWSR